MEFGAGSLLFVSAVLTSFFGLLAFCFDVYNSVNLKNKKKLYALTSIVLLSILFFSKFPRFQTISERWEGIYYSRMIETKGPDVLWKYRYGPLYPTSIFLLNKIFGFNINIISFFHLVLFSSSLILIWLISDTLYSSKNIGIKILPIFLFLLFYPINVLAGKIKGIFQMNIFLFLVVIYFLIKVLKSKNSKEFIVSSIHLSISIILFSLTKVENLAIVYPVAIAILIFKFKELREHAKLIFLISLFTLLMLVPMLQKYFDHRERAFCQNVDRPEIEEAFNKWEGLEAFTSREFSFYFVPLNFKKMSEVIPSIKFLLLLFLLFIITFLVKRETVFLTLLLTSFLFFSIYLFHCAYVVRSEYMLFQIPEFYSTIFISIPKILEIIYSDIKRKVKNYWKIVYILTIFVAAGSIIRIFTMKEYRDVLQDYELISKIVEEIERNNFTYPIFVPRHYEKFVWGSFYVDNDVFSLEQETGKMKQLDAFVLVVTPYSNIDVKNVSKDLGMKYKTFGSFNSFKVLIFARQEIRL